MSDETTTDEQGLPWPYGFPFDPDAELIVNGVTLRPTNGRFEDLSDAELGWVVRQALTRAPREWGDVRVDLVREGADA